MRPLAHALVALLAALPATAQPLQSVVIGDGLSWASGGGQRNPTVLIKRRGTSTAEDTTNTPGYAIDFAHRPGWITPLYFDPGQNISARVLSGEGAIGIDGAFYGATSKAQLTGTVNGDPDVAYERKPDAFNTTPNLRDVWVVLDFAVPVGVHRVRFFPRNTVVPNALYPFQEDYLRAYELWINPTLTDDGAPDRLVQRDTANDEAVVDVDVSPQYVRLVKIRSLTTVPYEYDEIEVYGTGYMQEGTYLSDILDLGDRATVGPLRWVEAVDGDSLFSDVDVRVRTGTDDTPILYLRVVRDAEGVPTGTQSVSPERYYNLERRDRATLVEDTENWSPWVQADNGGLIEAPVPRQFVQFRVDFTGGLFDSRQLDRIGFDYLVPPIADGLTAEVYPRRAVAEQPASFRYAVRLRADGQVRGFDRLEVDTNVGVTAVREATLDGQPFDVRIDEVRDDGFVLAFPLVQRDDALLEFTFDLPIFRFGTTFSGRAFLSQFDGVPQRLTPGNAQDFAPDDLAELSGLFVAIPEDNLGKLVGEIAAEPAVLTPNDDGVNDELRVQFNLLQLVQPAPVTLDIHDLAGHRLRRIDAGERGIGPGQVAWDGRDGEGVPVAPGLYLWVLRVDADAFEERHARTVGVVY
jgi:hypothetical protein